MRPSAAKDAPHKAKGASRRATLLAAAKRAQIREKNQRGTSQKRLPVRLATWVQFLAQMRVGGPCLNDFSDERSKNDKAMTVDEICEVMREMAEEVGIPYEQLMNNLRYSQLQPIFDFVRIKRELRMASNKAELDRLLAEQEAWLNMHPLWREHLRGKGESKP
jgi:hypothetical protein